MKYSILALFGFFLITSGCESELEDPIDDTYYGYDYFPVGDGVQRTYQVDSLQFDLLLSGDPGYDSTTFYLREIFVESYADETGETVYRIERQRADQPEGPYRHFDVITQSVTQNQGVQTEGNRRFIHLIFPLTKGERWDGNAYLNDGQMERVNGENIETYRNWAYRVLDVDQREDIGGKTYDQVATIEQADDETTLQLRRAMAKYARGVGLVHRERWILDSVCQQLGESSRCIDKPWKEIASKGYIVTETLLEARIP